MKRLAPRLILIALLAAPAARPAAAESPYDPLATSDQQLPPSLELTVQDKLRKQDVPLRVYLPADDKSAPVVLFSHGLGGSREGSAFLGAHWSARGYVAVFLQHPGSDASVWRDKRPAKRLQSMREAASGQNFLARVADVHAVLDQLEGWNGAPDHPLAGRLDLAHIGMSGHSFGAVTTQALSGQTFLRGAMNPADPRIKAAIAFSPSSPRQGKPADAFGDVKIPWLLMTGTEDTAPIGDQTVESRLAVFPALPPGDKYELVLAGAEHSAFTDRPLPGDQRERNPNHHRAILAFTTAFWDAYLRRDPAAKTWLTTDGPAKILEKADRWQKK